MNLVEAVKTILLSFIFIGKNKGFLPEVLTFWIAFTFQWGTDMAHVGLRSMPGFFWLLSKSCVIMTHPSSLGETLILCLLDSEFSCHFMKILIVLQVDSETPGGCWNGNLQIDCAENVFLLSQDSFQPIAKWLRLVVSWNLVWKGFSIECLAQ